VLSPPNKTNGHIGRFQYRRKQEDLLRSSVSLLEIDLLRRGEHTVAAPLAELARRGSWDYLVSLHHGGLGLEYDVWPVLLRDPMPRIRVPLAGGDPDLELDLQAVFTRFYDENAYARRIDYRSEPVPPLPATDREWARALVEERN
jgi:hypothetical protein